MFWLPEADHRVVRRAYSASDFALIVDRHAPAAGAELVAQRYGSVPIARATGGHLDTIVDADAALRTGSGFLFKAEGSEDLLGPCAAPSRLTVLRVSEN